MITNTKKCPVCSTKFESQRSDGKYCSPKCRVKAKYDRDKTKVIAVEVVKDIFYIDEYQTILNEMGVNSGDFPLILYCFYRRNLKGDSTSKDVFDYIDAVWEPGANVQKKQAYLEFEELFLSGKCEVNSSKKDTVQPQNIDK